MADACDCLRPTIRRSWWPQAIPLCERERAGGGGLNRAVDLLAVILLAGACSKEPEADPYGEHIQMADAGDEPVYCAAVFFRMADSPLLTESRDHNLRIARSFLAHSPQPDGEAKALGLARSGRRWGGNYDTQCTRRIDFAD